MDSSNDTIVYFENRFTGEALKTTKEKFILYNFNPNEWDEISEDRYDVLVALYRASNYKS